MKIGTQRDVSVILYNIRSAHNVGSVFRTSDGAGVSKIYLVGYTPTPVDRFGREQAEIAKTALGAHEIIPWKYHETPQELLNSLKEEGVKLVAVEQHKKSIDYKKLTIDSPTAFIFGNEIDGVSEDICNTADAVIEIPMYGSKESLNISVSAGVVLYRLLDTK